MSKRLLGLNALLALLSVLFAIQIGRGVVLPQARSTTNLRQTGSPPAKGTTRPAVGIPPEARQPLGSYASIAAKNLFSPARTESGGAASATAPAGPKPLLYGVVMRDGLSIAYLEDPGSKRVTGYRIGDAIAGGTLQEITADHIVLKRPEGDIDVRLRDPLKPRPAPVEPVAPTPPATPPAPAPAPPAAVVRPPGQPAGTFPGPPMLRRLPPMPPPIRDAPTR